MPQRGKPRVLILGGGYAGLYSALGLQKRLGRTPMEVTLLERNPYMTYQPLLPEVAGGHVLPRDVTIALRRMLPRVRIVRGELDSLDVDTRTATVLSMDGHRSTLDFDHVVFTLGAVTRVFPTPGLEENAVGFKTVEEAVFVRNRVLENIALAASTPDAAVRRRALTFLFVGGGYTGVEALAELSDVSKRAIRSYPHLDVTELRWVLIEALDRVAPEVGPALSVWTLASLRNRGVDIRLKTTVRSFVDGNVELDSGEVIPAGTIVWTAGVTPSPALDNTNVPRGPKGHVTANASLQVIRSDGSVVDGAWAAGDNAQIPDLTAPTQPAYYPPNAQNALRQGVRLAANIVATIDGGTIQQYRHASLGTIASYGTGHGAALVMGIKLRGLPAWLMHRAYHGLVIPSVNRTVRVFAGWFTEAISRQEVTSLVALEHPKRVFTEAFVGSRPPKDHDPQTDNHDHQAADQVSIQHDSKEKNMTDPTGVPTTDGNTDRVAAHDPDLAPRSEADTEVMQNTSVLSSETARDPEVDDSQIEVLPGTGGPDDVGDVEVDPAELNLSGDSIPGHPKPGSPEDR